MTYSFDITRKGRAQYLKFLNNYTCEQLNVIPEGFNNNIIWNIGHAIATQQALVYGLSGQEFKLPEGFMSRFKKGTKPEAKVSTAEIEEIKSLLTTTIDKTIVDLESGLFSQFKTYTLSTTGGTLSTVAEAIEFNNYHEGLHLGSCLAISKFIK